jgi:hypothetical protein
MPSVAALEGACSEEAQAISKAQRSSTHLDATADLRLPAAVLETLRLWGSQSKWCATTWQKILGTTMGAPKRASTHTDCPWDLPIAGASEVSDALAAAQKESTAFEANAPKACAKQQVFAAIAQAEAPVKEKLAIARLTAGRISDATRLKRDHTRLTGQGVAVTFRRGQTAGSAPFTVHTACPAEWRSFPQLALELQHIAVQPG